MDKKELIEKVIAKLSGDSELLKAVGELTLDMDKIEIAETQKPDTMYVLTGRILLKQEDTDKMRYHYHPIIEDCLLNPQATENKLVCAPSLVDLQAAQRLLQKSSVVDLVILAVKMETFEQLQRLLDETIADLLGSIRRAVEAFISGNEGRTSAGAIDFGDMYYTILFYLMTSTKTVIGSALNEESSIVETIDDVEYDARQFNPLQFEEAFDDDCDECDGECDNCDREQCCQEDEDEKDDSSTHFHGAFYGAIDKD